MIKNHLIDADISTRCTKCGRKLDYITLTRQVSNLVDDYDLKDKDVIDVDIEVNCKHCKRMYVPVLIARAGEKYYVKQKR